MNDGWENGPALMDGSLMFWCTTGFNNITSVFLKKKNFQKIIRWRNVIYITEDLLVRSIDGNLISGALHFNVDTSTRKKKQGGRGKNGIEQIVDLCIAQLVTLKMIIINRSLLGNDL